MYILGISAYYHDSSAALLKDGKLVCAFEEERFTRKKHDNSFPEKAIEKCFEHEGISGKDISYVSYYEKPLKKFERIVENFVFTYPLSARAFIDSMPEWLGGKIRVEGDIKKALGGIDSDKIFYVPHHLSHAALGYYTSEFKDSAILTVDGVGEYQTTGLYNGVNGEIKLLKKIDFPHSLGLFYSTLTSFLGFMVNNDEFKVMGLTAYGEPYYIKELREVINYKKDGSFKLNLSYFSFRESYKMWSRKLERLLGSPRKKGEPFSKRHKDIAASLQFVTEDILFNSMNHLQKITGARNLCFTGGVALNSLANGKIFSETNFENVHIFGPSGDGGSSLGAALYLHKKINPQSKFSDGFYNLHKGTKYENSDIEKSLKDEAAINFRKLHSKEEKIALTTNLLIRGNKIGWFQGKMEFGPRALGSRSILARPWPQEMKDNVNLIKKREAFRPFAGSVLEGSAERFFYMPTHKEDFPYMNFVFKVVESKRNKIPAIVHEDGTCRVQTVNKKDGLYYELIKRFEERTGIPVILNTSFNLSGEPIVESPRQAINSFLASKYMDYLIMGDYLVSRNTHQD